MMQAQRQSGPGAAQADAIEGGRRRASLQNDRPAASFTLFQTVNELDLGQSRCPHKFKRLSSSETSMTTRERAAANTNNIQERFCPGSAWS
jgi:hypothetical protein